MAGSSGGDQVRLVVGLWEEAQRLSDEGSFHGAILHFERAKRVLEDETTGADPGTKVQALLDELVGRVGAELEDHFTLFRGNYYAALGVRRGATSKEVKKAHRKFVLRFHPDKNPAYDTAPVFLLGQAAYEELADPVRRERYLPALSTADWLRRRAAEAKKLSAHDLARSGAGEPRHGRGGGAESKRQSSPSPPAKEAGGVDEDAMRAARRHAARERTQRRRKAAAEEKRKAADEEEESEKQWRRAAAPDPDATTGWLGRDDLEQLSGMRLKAALMEKAVPVDKSMVEKRDLVDAYLAAKRRWVEAWVAGLPVRDLKEQARRHNLRPSAFPEKVDLTAAIVEALLGEANTPSSSASSTSTAPPGTVSSGRSTSGGPPTPDPSAGAGVRGRCQTGPSASVEQEEPDAAPRSTPPHNPSRGLRRGAPTVSWAQVRRFEARFMPRQRSQRRQQEAGPSGRGADSPHHEAEPVSSGTARHEEEKTRASDSPPPHEIESEEEEDQATFVPPSPRAGEDWSRRASEVERDGYMGTREVEDVNIMGWAAAYDSLSEDEDEPVSPVPRSGERKQADGGRTGSGENPPWRGSEGRRMAQQHSWRAGIDPLDEYLSQHTGPAVVSDDEAVLHSSPSSSSSCSVEDPLDFDVDVVGWERFSLGGGARSLAEISLVGDESDEEDIPHRVQEELSHGEGD